MHKIIFNRIKSFIGYFQVNPIAVNSKYCNVFTENKRTVSIISTKEFGKVCTRYLLSFNPSHLYHVMRLLCFFHYLSQVAFVAIGATMVGSMTFVRKQGDYVHKGDEVLLYIEIYHQIASIPHCITSYTSH